LLRYFCRRGAKEATPNDGDDANICPIGFYCPELTVSPKPCPPGSYGTQAGRQNEDQCDGCDPGTKADYYQLSDILTVLI